MKFLNAVIDPFVRLFRAIQRVNQQVYCGGSAHCAGLSYQKGNIDQLIPIPVRVWQSCPLPREDERPR